MRYGYTFLVIFASLAISCKNSKSSEVSPVLAELEMNSVLDVDGEEVPIVDFDAFETLLNQDDGQTYVINFWATWCAPCVKELPYFEQVYKANQGKGLQMILVSLDMPQLWESRLVPFLREKDLKAPVIILDDPRENEWIPKVDAAWEGTIPATLIYSGNERKFYEKPFTLQELETAISQFKK